MINSVLILLLPVVTTIGALVGYQLSKRRYKMNIPHSKKPTAELSYSEVNEVIDDVFFEIAHNKYEIYYKLKELVTIPNMDEEIENITKDVLTSFSDEFLVLANRYYTYEYLILMITRKAQMFTIKYIQENKSSSK